MAVWSTRAGTKDDYPAVVKLFNQVRTQDWYCRPTERLKVFDLKGFEDYMGDNLYLEVVERDAQIVGAVTYVQMSREVVTANAFVLDLLALDTQIDRGKAAAYVTAAVFRKCKNMGFVTLHVRFSSSLGSVHELVRIAPTMQVKLHSQSPGARSDDNDVYYPIKATLDWYDASGLSLNG